MYLGACTFKNNKCYVFGGSPDNKNPSDICQVFDLTQETWSRIANLPVASCRNTAETIDNNIIVSGFHLNSVYLYNDLCFEQILKLSQYEKIVSKGWILIDGCLYENESNDIRKWISHTISVWNPLPLAAFTTFKKGKNIYFITIFLKLCRIDTVNKTVQEFSIT